MNGFRLLLLFCVVFFAGSSLAADYGVDVKQAEVVRSNDTYVLNADIDYVFSSRALEALQNGVPLTLIVRAKLHRYRKYAWNKSIVNAKLRYRLSYHALLRRYRVVNNSLGVQLNFGNLEDALDALGQVRDAPLIGADGIDADNRYIAQVKVSLDIESLPLPLRSVAYVIPQWHISSAWFKWQLEE